MNHASINIGNIGNKNQRRQNEAKTELYLNPTKLNSTELGTSLIK